jgi:hypothetical protein
VTGELPGADPGRSLDPMAVAVLEHLLDGASEERMRDVRNWLADDLVAEAWAGEWRKDRS